MTNVLLFLVLAFLASIVYYLYDMYTYWRRRGVPSERPWPLSGHIKGVGRKIHFRDIHQRTYELFKGTAPFAGLSFLTSRPVFLLDLDLIKNVLIKDFSSFQDRGTYNNVKDEPLSGHLFALEGEQWSAMRHKLSPVFSSGKMKFMFQTVRAVSDMLAQVCGEQMNKSPDHVVEFKELCARFTTDVIGNCAFGIECNSLHDKDAEFRLKGRAIFERPRHSQLVRSFMFMYPDMARKLHMKIFPDDISTFFMDIVRQTVDYRVKNNIKRNDFMDLIIGLRAQDQEAARKGDGIDLSEGLTLEQMAAQTLVFFLAGFDTSSTTMSFALYELALHPELQDRLRDEIVSVLEANDGELTYEAMTEMHYLDQVFSETLRKYPVLPHLARRAVVDYKVPGTKFVFKKGTHILIPINAIQHDPDIYPDPQDFDPERFTPEAVKQRHPCAYMPFGDGPRNCIGMRFGKMQTKIGLIKLLSQYKFSQTKRTEIPLEFSNTQLIIAPRNGVYLHVERI